MAGTLQTKQSLPDSIHLPVFRRTSCVADVELSTREIPAAETSSNMRVSQTHDELVRALAVAYFDELY